MNRRYETCVSSVATDFEKLAIYPGLHFLSGRCRLGDSSCYSSGLCGIFDRRARIRHRAKCLSVDSDGLSSSRFASKHTVFRLSISLLPRSCTADFSASGTPLPGGPFHLEPDKRGGSHRCRRIAQQARRGPCKTLGHTNYYLAVCSLPREHLCGAGKSADHAAWRIDCPGN